MSNKSGTHVCPIRVGPHATSMDIYINGSSKMSQVAALYD